MGFGAVLLWRLIPGTKSAEKSFGHTGLPRMLYPLPGPNFILFLDLAAGTPCIEGHFVSHLTAFSTVTNPENKIFVNIFHAFKTSLVSGLKVINLTKFLLKI